MSLVVADQIVASGSSGALTGVGAIIEIICVVIVVSDAWRSPASTGKKIAWTIFALLCSVISLIVWFVVGRRNAYKSTPNY